jgi:flagella basal body P-ring formation protein FlgA
MTRKECDKPTSPRRSQGLVWTGLAALAALVAGPGPEVQAGQLRFVERADVTGPQVTLGELAYLEGFFDSECETALADTVLFEAPEPGRRRVVDLREVREALYAAGINLGEVLLCGASRIEIRRPQGADDASGSAGQGDIERPNTLEDYLRAHIVASFREYDGKVEVRFSRTQAANKALDLSGPEFEFRLPPAGPPKLGLVSCAVEILREGRSLQTVHVLANVLLVRSVAVAARPINRGRIISAEDIHMSERRFSRLDQIGETDSRRLAGQEAVRFIERGELISLRDVKPVPLVRRNDLVTVWNRSGAVVVRTVGKALGTGALGQEIEVKSERSGKKYLARVTGVRTVEVNGADTHKVVMR